MTQKYKFVHQGDVPFYPYTGEIMGEKVKHNGSVVLALGEHTGHKHTITVPRLEDMEAYKLPDGGWLLKLKSGGSVKHNQHGEITVAPGLYRVGQEREHDWFQSVTRKVID